jgi:hypothetical protein
MNNNERGVEYERERKKKTLIIGMVNFFGCEKRAKNSVRMEWNVLLGSNRVDRMHMTRPIMV